MHSKERLSWLLTTTSHEIPPFPILHGSLVKTVSVAPSLPLLHDLAKEKRQKGPGR